MSHFAVLVVGEDIDGQLAPYDEDITVEPYIRNTRQELIENNRKDIERMRDGLYAEYLADPVAYLEESKHNQNHCFYFVSGEFAAKLEWNDEELYADAIKWLSPSDLDAEGNELSTYNPKSKWDWYQVGGRWDGALPTKDGKEVSETTIGDLALDSFKYTFAVVKEGEWYEKGEMGWFGMASNEKETDEWFDEFRRLLSDLPPETVVTIVDLHI